MSIIRNVGRLTAVTAMFIAGTAVTTPVAQAEPTICMTEARVACDPLYTRGTPEWQACFGAEYDACMALQPPDGPDWPNIPPFKP